MCEPFGSSYAPLISSFVGLSAASIFWVHVATTVRSAHIMRTAWRCATAAAAALLGASAAARRASAGADGERTSESDGSARRPSILRLELARLACPRRA